MKKIALRINKLNKVYNNKCVALNNLSLDILENDFFAVLGKNGAGKSTLINISAGITKKTSGIVEVCGHNIDKAPLLSKSCVSLVPQNFNFNRQETPLEILVNQAGFHGIRKKDAKKKAVESLSIVGLFEKRNSVSSELSGGMQRRVMLARALVTKPKLLILDEPTSGLDIESRYKIWEHLRLINKNNVTIVLTTHNLNEAEALCNNYAVIEHGSILDRGGISGLYGAATTKRFLIHTRECTVETLKLDGFQYTHKDPLLIEVTLSESQELNDLLLQLHREDVNITNVSCKTGHLESKMFNLNKKTKINTRASS